MKFFSPGYYKVIISFINSTGNANINENDIAMAKVFLSSFTFSMMKLKNNLMCIHLLTI